MFARWFSWRLVLACLWFVTAGLLASAAHAKGTYAGTVIPNEVVLSFEINGKEQTRRASSQPVVVVEVIDVVVTARETNPLAAKAGDVAKPLGFLVTNLGNGTETFTLARDNALTGDDFDPTSYAGGAIYLESGLEDGLQLSGPHADVVYVPGVNDPRLRPDASVLVYAPSDIAATVPQGGRGNLRLQASSATPGAAGAVPGALLKGAGDSGGDAMVGHTRARSAAVSGYVVSNVTLTVAKTITSVVDPRGGKRVMPGAVLTYRMVLTLTGDGVAEGVVLTDPLPAETTYVANSLLVDGAARTDAADSDNAAFSDGTVTVNWGDVTAPATRLVEFKVTVN